jgi:trimethylamine--corrinoid protein Co-methyltransferase
MGSRSRRRDRNRTTPRALDGACPIRAGMEGGRFQPLTEHDVQRIHQTSLDVLENYGMADPTDSCRELLLSNGCFLNDRGRLCFPRTLVEDVIADCGRGFTLHARNPEFDLDVSGARVHFSGSTAAINVLDIDTGHYREALLGDVYDLARAQDAMENLHFVHRPCIARDMPNSHMLDLNTAYAMMSATDKHFVTSFFEPEHLIEAVQMFDVSLGREGSYKQRPFSMLVCAFVVSPLRFAGDSCRTLEAAVASGMPIWTASAAQAGATSPTALAGALMQGNAECLAALVYINLLAPRHPVVMGNWPFVSDLRNGSFSGGGGEIGLLNAAAVQLSRFYDIPVTVGAGMTDSKSADVQSGWEKGYLTAMCGLAGGNLLGGGIGGHASLMGFSVESLVIDNDMLGAVLRTVRGIEVNDDTLSYEVIGKVIDGPGHYLTQPQTFERMASDYVYPKIGNRDTIDVWEEKGQPDIREAAKQRAREILNSHFPSHIDKQMDDLIRTRFDIRLPRERMRPLA